MPRNAPPLNLEPLMTATQTAEIFHVDDRTVACDGGVGALGHPRVFLRITGRDVTCPYCSRHYILNEGAGHDSGH